MKGLLTNLARARTGLHRALFLQSQRDCAPKPRVARNELPWVKRSIYINPEGVASRTEERGGRNHVVVDEFLVRLSQGRRCQPWALGRNPVGILGSVLICALSLFANV